MLTSSAIVRSAATALADGGMARDRSAVPTPPTRRLDAILHVIDVVVRDMPNVDPTTRVALVRLTDALARIVNLPPQPLESLRDFTRRLVATLSALPAAARDQIEKQLNQQSLLLAVKSLVETLRPTLTNDPAMDIPGSRLAARAADIDDGEDRPFRQPVIQAPLPTRPVPAQPAHLASGTPRFQEALGEAFASPQAPTTAATAAQFAFDTGEDVFPSFREAVAFLAQDEHALSQAVAIARAQAGDAVLAAADPASDDFADETGQSPSTGTRTPDRLERPGDEAEDTSREARAFNDPRSAPLPDRPASSRALPTSERAAWPLPAPSSASTREQGAPAGPALPGEPSEAGRVQPRRPEGADWHPPQAASGPAGAAAAADAADLPEPVVILTDAAGTPDAPVEPDSSLRRAGVALPLGLVIPPPLAFEASASSAPPDAWETLFTMLSGGGGDPAEPTDAQPGHAVPSDPHEDKRSLTEARPQAEPHETAAFPARADVNAATGRPAALPVPGDDAAMAAILMPLPDTAPAQPPIAFSFVPYLPAEATANDIKDDEDDPLRRDGEDGNEPRQNENGRGDGEDAPDSLAAREEGDDDAQGERPFEQADGDADAYGLYQRLADLS